MKETLSPNTVLQDRYKVVRQLGQGGMGTVYEAIDQRLDTTVALKETFFADERLRKQFEREARLLARLHHPALPRVSDHFSEGDGQFLVMQFIPGDDLSEMMAQRRGPFPPDQVLTWTDQLLDALDYLHTQEPQIIHRDIKPQNLKLTSRGQIILLDFGLAKGQAGEISRITTSASIFGYTPNYAPLEQIQGLGTDSRSDLYSLAATVYHLLTGAKPPDALTRAAALVNAQPDPLTPATDLNPTVAPEVSAVLHQAMAQNREQRFASASEMRKVLHRTAQTSTVINRAEAQTILRPPPVASTIGTASTQAAPQQPTVATGETTVVRPLRVSPGRRVLPWVLSGAALLLVGVCVLGFYLVQHRNDAIVKAGEPTPSPSLSPSATAAPSLSATDHPVSIATPVTAPTAEARAPKKTETPRPTDEAKRQNKAEAVRTPPPTPHTSSGHERDEEDFPEVPKDPFNPRTPRPKINTSGVPTITVGPNGSVVRTFPDGSKLISGPDGSRVFISADGKRQVLHPPRQLNRPRPQPTP